MHNKKFKEKYSKKVSKNKVMNKKRVDVSWISKIFFLTFTISLIFSLLSESVIPNTYLWISIFLVVMFIIIGVLFDMIGISVTAADPKVFHSMASKRVFGSKTAIKLIKNAEKTSSFCNDVIGDICGVISGSCGVTISLKLSGILNIPVLPITLIITALIASFTIGGKAIGKSFAVNQSNAILFYFSKIIAVFTKDK